MIAQPPPAHDALTARFHRAGELSAGFALAYPKAIAAVCMVVFGGFSLLGLRSEISADYRVFFAADDEDVLALSAFEEKFSKTDNVVFVVKPHQGDVFQPAALNAIAELTEASWDLPNAERVDALTNFPRTRAVDDDLDVGALLPVPANTLSPQGLAEIKAWAEQEPLLQGALLGPQSKAGGVHVTLRLDPEHPEAIAETATAAYALVDKTRAAYPQLDIRASGLGLMNNALMETSLEDSMRMVPAMCLAMLLIMLLLLKSGWATLFVVLLIALSAGVAAGLGGLMGYPLTPPSACASVIVITLCIADGVHLYYGIRRALLDGLSQNAAIIHSVKMNFKPIFLTSATSCIGFLALNFSESPPFHHLANMTTAGVITAFCLSVTFLPALFSLKPLNVTARKKVRADGKAGSGDFWTRWAHTVAAHRHAILGAGALVTVVSVYGASLLESNDQFVQYFDESVAFRQDTEFMVANLGGIYVLDFELRASGDGEVSDPAYLRHVDAFASWLRAQPAITHVSALSDIQKRVGQSLNGDAPAAYALPTDQKVAAQQLLLYEMSLPSELPLSERVAVDKSSSRVTAVVKNIKSAEMRQLAQDSTLWLSRNTPAFMHTVPHAPVVIFSELAQKNTTSMFWGNLLTLLLISLSLVFTLRSRRLGLASLVPNLVPIFTAYGLWTLLVGEINIIASVAGAICLGLIVDDTIHVLSKYRHARTQLGLHAEAAVTYTMRHCGNALVTTSLILAVGFFVLSQSQFQMNSYFGALVVLVVLSALLCDLTLLPALLLVFDAAPKSAPPKSAPLKTRSTVARRGRRVMAWLGVFALGFGISFAAAAKAPHPESNEDGESIVDSLTEDGSGWVDVKADLEMVLTTKSGKTVGRKMRLKALEGKEGPGHSLLIFDTPNDIAGTALLSTGGKDAKQYLYLPATGRVRRISGTKRSASFVGSEFSYEDINGVDRTQHAWKLLKEMPCGEASCYVIQSTPLYSDSAYKRRILWIHKADFRPLKVQYYDRNNEKLKTLSYSGYKKFKNGKWRAKQWHMKNHKTGRATVMKFSKYEFENDFSETDFDKSALKRTR